MAADRQAMDVEQVLELVLNGSDHEEDDESNASESKNSGQEVVKEKLVGFLDSLEGGPAFNKIFFRDSALEMLTPLVHSSCKEPHETADMEAFRLLSSSFSYLPVIRRESVHWLDAIYRRLGGRNRIRNPYNAEIRRDIPYEIFGVVVRVVKNVAVAEFCPPHCFYAKNKAAEVISFTTYHSVTKLFSLLSGYERKVVGRYLKRTLGGKRKGHKVKILISDIKDLAFVYNSRKEQLTICYNYGEWNIHGFPQHS